MQTRLLARQTPLNSVFFFFKFEPLELVNVPFETHRSGVPQIDEGLLVGQMTS